MCSLAVNSLKIAQTHTTIRKQSLGNIMQRWIIIKPLVEILEYYL